MTDSELPESLGRYRVLSRIGAGGMAEVFLAKSSGAEGIEKILVVKRILPTFARSAKFLTMFIDEAKVAVRLNHPNIVQVYGFEQVRDQLLLAMEHVDGLDLGRLLAAARRRERRMPFAIAAYVVAQIAKGLDYAHNRKDEQGERMDIVHRDVSPQNVLLSYEGAVKVADFGIAKARLVSEETGVIKGKFSYMSPEQARGERVDRRSDVYALGVLLAELLMNRAMYPGQQGLEVLEEVRAGNLTLPRDVDPEVPQELERIVRRATAYDREERFQTARSLAQGLVQYLHGEDEVFDAEALERFIGSVAPREKTSPDVVGRGVVVGTARTIASQESAVEAREHRERRHVVVVSATVRGHATDSDEASAPGIGVEAARVLDEIAFKKDAVLSWPEGTGRAHLRFILGLGRPTVHDPLEAVRLGLDVLDALQGLSADMLKPVTASIGISRGVMSTVREATGRLKRYEPVGSVLDVAEQLADAAEPSEVLVAGAVYRLVRRSFAFDEEPREIDVETEGGTSTRGVRSYRLRGVLTREQRAAEVLAPAGGGAGLIGRGDEIESLSQAYHEAVTSGRTGYVSVVGELGVGKSALVATALESLKPGPRVLRSECTFGTADVPWAATAELVREACGIPDDAPSEQAHAQLERTLELLVDKRKLRQTALHGLAPLVSQVRAEVEAEGEDRSHTIRQAVEVLLFALARQGPLLLWVDAVQWIDLPSLELVRAMIQREYPVPILVVLATRPDERVEKVLDEIPSIPLSELGPEDRVELIGARFGRASVSADIERAIVERAGGNPFFIIELVDALLERGVVKVEGEGEAARVVRRPGVPIALPTSLEGIIAVRLGELPDVQRRALRWLAVAGPGLRAEDLSTLAGEDLTEALGELERRDLLLSRQGGSFGFPSAVVRHVAYETSEDDDRVRMHRRIAAYLSQDGRDAPPARIARHLEHAGEEGAAAAAYMDAANSAREVYSNREALRFYGRALALLPPASPRRFHAHEAREQILRGMGRRQEQLRELEMMRAYADHVGDPILTALAYNRTARHRLEGGDTDGVEALVERALSSARESKDLGAEVEALRLTAQLARHLNDAPRALEACDEALAKAADRRELLAARGSVRVVKGEVLRHLGRLEEAQEVDAEALVIFRRLGLKRNEAQALNALGVILASAGDFEDAIDLIRASIAVDWEIGDRYHLGRKLSNVGQLYGELGDMEKGLDFLERAQTVFEAGIGDLLSQGDTLCALAEIVLELRDDHRTAEEHLDHALAISTRTRDPYDRTRERLIRAALLRRRDRLGDAERRAREAHGLAREAGIVSYQLEAQACLAEILAARGDAAEARTTADEARRGLLSRDVVERAERIFLMLLRAYRILGDDERARETKQRATDLIDVRVGHIRDPMLRLRYLSTPTVTGIRGMA